MIERMVLVVERVHTERKKCPMRETETETERERERLT